MFVCYVVYHISIAMLWLTNVFIVLCVEQKILNQTFSQLNLHLPPNGVYYVEMMAL